MSGNSNMPCELWEQIVRCLLGGVTGEERLKGGWQLRGGFYAPRKPYVYNFFQVCPMSTLQELCLPGCPRHHHCSRYFLPCEIFAAPLQALVGQKQVSCRTWGTKSWQSTHTTHVSAFLWTEDVWAKTGQLSCVYTVVPSDKWFVVSAAHWKLRGAKIKKALDQSAIWGCVELHKPVRSKNFSVFSAAATTKAAHCIPKSITALFTSTFPMFRSNGNTI